MAGRATRILVLLSLVAAGALGLATGGSAQGGGIAYSIELSGTVDPASERWLGDALDDAAEASADLAIIRLDTPGGLDSSLRQMVKDTIAAPMPVVVYVSPGGARAGSAGAYLTQAADVAAMAPQTNIGSATPISIGPGDIPDDLERKIRHDAEAYMRALAEEHGRNGDLAERMVTRAANFTAEEALRENLVDVIAPGEEQLVADLDGFRVQGSKAQTLRTEGLRIERHDMPLHLELLQIIVNPNVAFLLLLVGLAGIAIEVFNPGMIIPGGLGAVSLVMGLYGTAQLPVTIAGIVLLLLAVALIVAEAHLPSGGALGVAGVAALVSGGLLLFDTDSDAFRVNPPVVIAVGILVGGLGLLIAQRVVRAQRQTRVMTGWEEMIGEEAEVRAAIDPVGQVFVEGALWRARPVEDGEAIEPGARVRVVEVDGLTLVVERV
jgi:membrane-bound serine protease (ClpP class)